MVFYYSSPDKDRIVKRMTEEELRNRELNPYAFIYWERMTLGSNDNSSSMGSSGWDYTKRNTLHFSSASLGLRLRPMHFKTVNRN